MCFAICTLQEVVGDWRDLEEGGFLAGWELTVAVETESS